MNLADAIEKTVSCVEFYGCDGALVDICFLETTTECRIMAGKTAARVFRILVGCYELFYDATGRYLGCSVFYALAA
jgi:hypothetical protein